MFSEDERFRGRLESPPAWLEVERLEPRTNRLNQFGLLVVGMVGLWAVHSIARWPTDSSTTRVLLGCAAGTAIALWVIAKAVRSFITSIERGQDRIFRSRHLLGCGLVQLGASVVLSLSLVNRDPFSRLLAHGAVTGPDIVDLGYVAAAGVCLFGAFTALIAASEAHQVERRWHRYL
jgi:hypothetical protein